MLETLAIIALVYLLVAAAVANLEVLTDFFGVGSPANTFLLGLAWPAALVALTLDAISWVIFKLRF